jgi:NADH-ubiquinone oxidoreductase chain 4
MYLSLLLLLPLLGIFVIYSNDYYNNSKILSSNTIAFSVSILDLIISLLILLEYDYSNNQFQFIETNYFLNYFNLYMGLDGISIYFVILTNIIIPLAILSNWNSIKDKKKAYLVIMLLLQTLLLGVFLVLDYLLFYIFFESTLPPLFLLIGLFGSKDKVRASFYLFLYTLWGSLFLLLAIITLSSFLSNTDFNFMFKTNIDYTIQLFLFCGIFLAFAVKTPTIFLNNWLLKAHVESPLGGSIILAAIVLKLSLYGIFRLILPILPKIYINYTYLIFTVGVITILYASISTLRTIDIKELIAYSSVSHAAVYLIGSFSNVIQAIEGSILLGIAHGFVSSGLFICVGGILYDRFGTRLIYYYKGMTQIMPVFSLLFFILCLANCGVPLSLNFLGEFLCLYGTFERLPLLGLLASTSIVLSAAYTMYMYNRISFGGIYSKFFDNYSIDVTKREFFLLLILILFTVILGIYPALILDGLHYVASLLLYNL